MLLTLDPRAPKEVRYQHVPKVRHAARTNFMKFHQREEVCEEEIEESALGVSGWAFAHVRNQQLVDIGESITLGDCAFGNCMSIDP